jgi:hypothetical protein
MAADQEVDAEGGEDECCPAEEQRLLGEVGRRTDATCQPTQDRMAARRQQIGVGLCAQPLQLECRVGDRARDVRLVVLVGDQSRQQAEQRDAEHRAAQSHGPQLLRPTVHPEELEHEVRDDHDRPEQAEVGGEQERAPDAEPCECGGGDRPAFGHPQQRHDQREVDPEVVERGVAGERALEHPRVEREDVAPEERDDRVHPEPVEEREPEEARQDEAGEEEDIEAADEAEHGLEGQGDERLNRLGDRDRGIPGKPFGSAVQIVVVEREGRATLLVDRPVRADAQRRVGGAAQHPRVEVPDQRREPDERQQQKHEEGGCEPHPTPCAK